MLNHNCEKAAIMRKTKSWDILILLQFFSNISEKCKVALWESQLCQNYAAIMKKACCDSYKWAISHYAIQCHNCKI